MFYGRKIGLFNLGYQLARKVDLVITALQSCQCIQTLYTSQRFNLCSLEVKLQRQIHIYGQICDRGCIVFLYTFSLCSGLKQQRLFNKMPKKLHLKQKSEYFSHCLQRQILLHSTEIPKGKSLGKKTLSGVGIGIDGLQHSEVPATTFYLTTRSGGRQVLFLKKQAGILLEQSSIRHHEQKER